VTRGLVWLLAVAVLLAASWACSPEASRSRNAGPGADIGNHSTNMPERSTAPKIGD
jgi:hypothetical protein